MALKIQDIGRPEGYKRAKKRVGRGIGSGKGKTSGKGHKGARSRSGGGTYTPGFEGGQMPLVRRVPKRGFNNKFKKKWSIVNTGTLQKLKSVKDGAVVDKDFLIESRIIEKKRLPFKVLGKGALNKSITVKADAFSSAAEKIIKEAGGTAKTV